MTQLTTLSDDPFFRLTGDTEWNACIGPQGHEENYVDGYMEAALYLSRAVLEKQLHISRPDGQVKFPHPWPPQIPPGRTAGL